MAKNRNFYVYIFFSIFTPAEAHRLGFPQIIARQFGINFTDEDVQNISMKERRNWLKRNPVTVARHMDYKYKVIFSRTVLMSGMHPIGKVFNYDSKREFQLKGPEYPHCDFHIMAATTIDENGHSEVTVFIDKYVTCSIPNKKEYLALNKFVSKVQKHRHTFTCRKKKGVTCRFNATWPPSYETRIVRGTNVSENELKRRK